MGAALPPETVRQLARTNRQRRDESLLRCGGIETDLPTNDQADKINDELDSPNFPRWGYEAKKLGE